MSKSNASWKGKGKLRRDSKSGRKLDESFGKKKIVNSEKVTREWHNLVKSHMNNLYVCQRTHEITECKNGP